MLNKAIAAVEDENDALSGVRKNNIDFNAVKGKTKIPDQKWKDLLDHFNQPQFVLVNDNFEFLDLLGAAYEYRISTLRIALGKKAATPRNVSDTYAGVLIVLWEIVNNQDSSAHPTGIMQIQDRPESVRGTKRLLLTSIPALLAEIH